MYYKRGATGVVEREYTYDTLGRPTARNTARQGTTRNDTFSYNNRSELTGATVSGESYGYDYDNIGNRKSAQEAAEEVTSYAANTLNHYTAIGDFAPTYDTDGNQTKVKTATGIWNIEYNAENRPILFTRTEEDGTETQIACTYDSMGRRATKKVTTGGTVTLHQRYLYRGYLQIACCDLTRSGHPCLWLILWDPTQPVATRPLAIQKDSTWYTYGWDLTKDICEVFGPNGYIRTAYTYTPYASVTEEGDVTQPIQWSSEYADGELGLTYHNYRHYNPADGRWLSYDSAYSSPNLYHYVKNTPLLRGDYIGLFLFSQEQPSTDPITLAPNPDKSCKACNEKIQTYKSQMQSLFGDELDLGPCPYTLTCMTCKERDKKYPHLADHDNIKTPGWTLFPSMNRREKKLLWMIIRKKKVKVEIQIACYPEIGEEFLVHETQHAVDYCNSIAYTLKDVKRYHMCKEMRAYSKANVARDQVGEEQFKNELFQRAYSSYSSTMKDKVLTVSEKDARETFDELYTSGNCLKDHY